MGQIKTVKGINEKEELVDGGKIRLGIKVKSGDGERPKEMDYFVLKDVPEVAAVYGDSPKEIDIVFPSEDIQITMPYAYQQFGSGKGMICEGDGEVGFEVINFETKEKKEVPCPCKKIDSRKCSLRGYIRIILPLVSVDRVYTIPTTSIISIGNIENSFKNLQRILGRVAGIPLKLRRVPKDTHHGGKKQVHYVLQVHLDKPFEEAKQLVLESGPQQYALPEYVEENPDGETTVTQEEDIDKITGEVHEATVVEEPEPTPSPVIGTYAPGDKVREMEQQLRSATSISHLNNLYKRLAEAFLTITSEGVSYLENVKAEVEAEMASKATVPTGDKEGTTDYTTVQDFKDRIDKVANKPELTNWKKKHQPEIDALSGEDKAEVMKHYFEKNGTFNK